MITIPPVLARSVLNDAPDAMIIVDGFGTIWFANRQVSTLFGYAHEEIIGENMEKLMPQRFRSEHVGHRGLANDLRVRPTGSGFDLIGQRRDGTEFALEVSLSPIEDAGQSLVAAAIRDISERKRTEASLLVARDAIEALRELADRSDSGRQRFERAICASLCWNLQSSITNCGAITRARVPPEDLSRQEQAIGAMARLLRDLFDIGRLELGTMVPAAADFGVTAVLDELRAEFSGAAEAKGLALLIEPCDAILHSDPGLVQQIIRTLLSNAVRYTQLGSVRLYCRPETASVRIEVVDTGVDIPADQLPFFFHEYYQVDDPTDGAAHAGFGLGLSVAQLLADLLKLQLEVRSDVGNCSTFSIAVPVAGLQLRH
jgi:two-component system, sensor histidine kinase